MKSTKPCGSTRGCFWAMEVRICCNPSVSWWARCVSQPGRRSEDRSEVTSSSLRPLRSFKSWMFWLVKLMKKSKIKILFLPGLLAKLHAWWEINYTFNIMRLIEQSLCTEWQKNVYAKGKFNQIIGKQDKSDSYSGKQEWFRLWYKIDHWWSSIQTTHLGWLG